MSREQKRRVYPAFASRRSKVSTLTFKIIAGLMALLLFAGAILMALLPAFI
jgi:hypothetical protein